jgi:hypothetical protein
MRRFPRTTVVLVFLVVSVLGQLLGLGPAMAGTG